MKKLLFLFTGLLSIIIVLTITRAVVSNTLSTSGIDLNRLDDEIHTYKRETALMEEKLLHAAAYTTLQEEAKKRGYEQATSQIILSSPIPMALNR
ncbi:MAG: hypothetical protein HYV40_01530 [Candidatus Levybacteria bacterium]|nr:hypothetical protein [Candidatus Levybacteria bacterium]